jgi:endonuclease/exonuclease/phosphatase family metal-dependent hydrolase
MLRHFSSNLKNSSRPAPAAVTSFQHDHAAGPEKLTQDSLRLLTYNMQVGINSRSFRHYLTRSWQHLLPHPGRIDNLDSIAAMLSGFDVVALQEADGGSIRSGHLNQVQYLAEMAGFPYWYQQLNRNLGKLAQHSNGVLSRVRPEIIEDHKLPGLVPGRGAIFMRFGSEKESLIFVVLHLSLGRRAQLDQLAYIKELISDYKHVVIMGDLNSRSEQILQLSPLSDVKLQCPEGTYNTYPSWRPVANLDHILVSSSLCIKSAEVVSYALSDHLPVAVEIGLPGQISPLH